MTFDKIATVLLQEHGYKPLPCESDEEAIEKAEALKAGSRLYPVHFSCSDTSGEKAYEEFYTESEHVDLNRLNALGVITGKELPDKEKIQRLLEALNKVFDGIETTKEEVISIIKEYLPNFDHIETGRSLDSKM